MSDYIPFCIQGEIMKRLPTKSLMQFRSVSKTWKSYIDSPKFISDYSTLKTHQHHMLVRYKDTANHELKFFSVLDDESFPREKFPLISPVQGEDRAPLVLGVSQGLFCLLHSNESAVLWNPCIKKSIVVAPALMAGRFGHRVIGFGVCPRTNDPKLVHINYLPCIPYLDITPPPWQVKVYTLSSRVWRRIPLINRPRSTIMMTLVQVAVDEFIYWLAIDWINENSKYVTHNLIMSFNMTNEEFMEVRFPDSLAHSKYPLDIYKRNGSLVVLETIVQPVKPVFVVWMMERGFSKNSFTKLFTINAPDASILILHGFRKNNEPVFGTRTDSDVEDVFVRELNSGHINYVAISRTASPSYMETLLLLDQ